VELASGSGQGQRVVCQSSKAQRVAIRQVGNGFADGKPTSARATAKGRGPGEGKRTAEEGNKGQAEGRAKARRG